VDCRPNHREHLVGFSGGGFATGAVTSSRETAATFCSRSYFSNSWPSSSNSYSKQQLKQWKQSLLRPLQSPWDCSLEPMCCCDTKKKESRRKCDLFKTLWIAEDRFTTKENLPEQDLGRIQHTCEAPAAAHTEAHHQCWHLIHGELARLASPVGQPGN
jgi:hypothetical protein